MTSDTLQELAIAIRMSSCTGPGKPWTVRFNDSTVMKELSANGKRLNELATRYLPGKVLETGANINAKTLCEKLKESAALGSFPHVISVTGSGIYTCAPGANDALTIAKCLELENPFVQSAAATGRLSGCIAVITGSAQGFGKGIAEECAREGACITVADLNEKLGNECAGELNGTYGCGTAIFCRADVTSMQSIESLVEATVRAFGGLDMLISNAGVLKAGAIHEFDERSFDLVTNVNYKAYFLCTKAVTPVMKLQHVFNPAHFMDIIQVNSKSGLQGSNRNFAYAGSKFGSIGLTQSFAMELVEHNIKVNAICPGNYFEGPLWSDPENGLFVQYLRAGKVPGAKTIEDVKKSYTDKVPMKRGCFPSDVARAIIYIHEQQYETGQAIPVTGGQVMLN